VTELRRVELNMKLRRLHVQHQLLPHERLLSLSVFPLMGVGAFTDPAYSPQGPVAQSLFTPDEVIFQHKRFPCVPHTLLRYWRFLLTTFASHSLFSPFFLSMFLYNYF
jgi:glutamate--cysteine ligase catalytic subunit